MLSEVAGGGREGGREGEREREILSLWTERMVRENGWGGEGFGRPPPLPGPDPGRAGPGLGPGSAEREAYRRVVTPCAK